MTSSLFGSSLLNMPLFGDPSPPLKDFSNDILINNVTNSWECRLCRKNFKERKDIEQHLNSTTHDSVKYSCNDCGKGFASLGALTLHIEQAGHPRGGFVNQEMLAAINTEGNGKQSCNECAKSFATLGALTLHVEQAGHALKNMDTIRNVETITGNVFKGATPSNNNLISQKHSIHAQKQGITSPLPIVKDGNSVPLHPKLGFPSLAPPTSSHLHQQLQQLQQQQQQTLTPTPIGPPLSSKNTFMKSPLSLQQQLPSPFQTSPFVAAPRVNSINDNYRNSVDPYLPEKTYYLHMFTYTERLSLTAGCHFAITDPLAGSVLSKSSFAIQQLYLQSIQPEYETLIRGLVNAIQLGLRSVVVVTTSQLLYHHLHTGTIVPFLQSLYFEERGLMSRLKLLLVEFKQVDAEFVPPRNCVREIEVAKESFLRHSFEITDDNERQRAFEKAANSLQPRFFKLFTLDESVFVPL